MSKWQQWFAWHPVRLYISNRIVWLTHVYRREVCTHTGPYAYNDNLICRYQYRLIDPTSYEELDDLLAEAISVIRPSPPESRLVK